MLETWRRAIQNSYCTLGSRYGLKALPARLPCPVDSITELKHDGVSQCPPACAAILHAGGGLLQKRGISGSSNSYGHLYLIEGSCGSRSFGLFVNNGKI